MLLYLRLLSYKFIVFQVSIVSPIFFFKDFLPDGRLQSYEKKSYFKQRKKINFKLKLFFRII